uniref:RRM domain-containing protein n=1 Tax=Beta vulgaris subsp. vulgaris TaxID=3555 RepID=F4NCF6_BETVV|nr:hypothetical protein [Beta vulgaris subsp. vulgaris]
MGENIPRERNPQKSQPENKENPWITVNRKKTRTPNPQASRTCFVNHLPQSITISEIARVFRTHGAIADITIPKNQKQLAHKFAFVQFHYPQSLITAIRDENRRKVEDNLISVFPAKYDKSQTTLTNTYNYKQSGPSTNKKIPIKVASAPYVRDGRSYKEATNTTKTSNNLSNHHQTPHPNHHQKPTPANQPHQRNEPALPFEEYVPTINSCKPKPTTHRIMSSRALGEDTEKIRNSLGAIDPDSDYAAAIKGQICEENEEMLQRSSIALALASQKSEIILDHILAEGVNCLSIKPMGGMLHLITFDTFENKKAIIESEWLQRWFSKIINVNTRSVSLWRETWVNIYGVPLIAWGYNNFHNIGSMLGRVLSVNYNNFDCAKVLIYTDCFFDINCKISFEIGEEKYPVYVSEKQQLWQTQSKPKSTDGELKNEKDENIMSNQSEQFPGMSPPVENDVTHNWNVKSPFPNTEHMTINDENDEINTADTFLPPLPISKTDNQTKNNKNMHNLSSQDNVLNCNHHQETNSNQQRHLTYPTSPDGIPVPTPKNPKPQSSALSPENRNDPNTLHHESPKIQPNDQNKQITPIKISNPFGPLMRPNKSSTTSTTTLGSSSSSGPLFPPGFEDTIPAQIKLEREKKRKKKMEKRRRLKKASSASKRNMKPSSNLHLPMGVQVDDVIGIAKILGLSFKGPESELKKRIENILQTQRQLWETSVV